MVKFKIRNKIIAVLAFIVMSVIVTFNGYDMQKAGAAGGTDYVKYTYATSQTQTYTLPEIPIYNNYLNARSSINFDDNRADADITPLVVKTISNSSNPDYKGNTTSTGTGFIIGDHEIMTAAHCVYNTQMGKPYYSMNVKITESSDNSSSIRTLNVISAHFPKEFKDYHDLNPSNIGTQDQIKLDYAIITVQEDLSEYGKLSLGAATYDIKNNNVPIHVLGYNSSALKISHGVVNAINDYIYGVTAYTTSGTSGGPIYVESSFGVPGNTSDDYKIQTYKTVIGLCSAGSYSSRFDSETLQFAYDNEYL